jgi:hypothetical protein
MSEKFLGDWQYHFITPDASGSVTPTRKGRFNLKTIDGNGKITDAKDDDAKPLTGQISKAGSLETIHIIRADDPKRHLRGILAFDRVIAGKRVMVLVGERRGDPFPLAPDRGTDKKEEVTAQQDGVWIATKP